jgi:hypothetical protein
LVFLPEVPFGVVPIAIERTTNPEKLMITAQIFTMQRISLLRLLEEVLHITGIARRNRAIGSCPRYLNNQFPDFSKE